MSTLTLSRVRELAKQNNRSVLVSDRLLVCLVWKESGFDDAVKNAASSAVGLMQVTRGAVKDVNDKSRLAETFDYGTMTDAATNIRCGSAYLDLRIKWAGGDIKTGIEKYGTGSGYADNLLACETCMEKQWPNGTDEQLRPCLFAIHT